MAERPWPAPPSSEAPWRLERFPLDDTGTVAPGGRRTGEVRVREVMLWGRRVLINEANEVFCDDCWRFLQVEVLGRAGNTHRAGLTDWSGRLLPMRDDEPAERAPRWMSEGF